MVSKEALVVGGIVAIVLVVVVWMVVKGMMKKKGAGTGGSSMPGPPKAQGTSGDVYSLHQIYGTHLRQGCYPSGENRCGAYGDVSNCPKYMEPTLVGEDRAIYAIHNGTIHDPRLKSRMCSYNPALLCGDTSCTPDTEGAWDYPQCIDGAHEGPGYELLQAYGYNARKALIEGGSMPEY